MNVRKKRLLPFLASYYPAGKFICWPDLASAHHSKQTSKWLSDAEIPILQMDINPPCVPQIQRIERFCAHLKSKVYDMVDNPKSAGTLSEN